MSDVKEVKVTKLEIQLSDDKITLSTADAKKLYEALSDIFASKRVEVWPDYWTYRPHYNHPWQVYYCSGLGQSNLQGGGIGNSIFSQATLQLAVNS